MDRVEKNRREQMRRKKNRLTPVFEEECPGGISAFRLSIPPELL